MKFRDRFLAAACYGLAIALLLMAWHYRAELRW
jgi:hypothetical protein